MKRFLPLLLTLVIMACGESPRNAKQTAGEPPIYPDYKDVTIPENIAPMNFLLRGEPQRVAVEVNGKEFYNGRGDAVEFSARAWRRLLAENRGKTVEVKVFAKHADGWRAYRPFHWTVSTDRVDPYLTYRLIEPDYEVFHHLVMQERCVENFDVRNISDYNIVGNRCMNCHTYASQDASTSMLYLRGEGGGAILNTGGRLQKLNLKRDDMVSGSVYFGFSPSRQFVAFSTNVIIPAFHSAGSKRLEVFDSKSDVYVANLATREFLACPALADTARLETFPTFSPDGRYLYFCSAPRFDSIPQLRQLRYSLCRIAFDESSAAFGREIETVYDGPARGKSVCHPRVSPDGRFIVYTTADYGTFPIWHREADLEMMELATGRIVSMRLANSDMSDTYHSWSSNSRWLVFASKRDDGLYGKPYYTHIDAQGRCTKPFALPQQHPHFYDNCLKSFNIPEQGNAPLPFNAAQLAEALEQEAVQFK